jgi:putative glycosyltransferase (TIGR04348 family)
VSFRRHNPEAPVIVALTGTDLYRDIPSNHLARKSLEIATRIVVLQPKAFDELRPSLREKTRIIYQSVDGPRNPASSREPKTRATKSKRRERFSGNFDVCVIGHLRAVKDPFRTSMAARLLPRSSRIRVLQVGGAMTEAMAARAHREMHTNRRYQWLGEQTPSRVRRILARSNVSVLSSRIEGGANVLSEAVVNAVPILASRIDGNIGILGADYQGLFGVGNTKQLARLLTRVETDPKYLAELRDRCQKLAPLFDPRSEEQTWADLISELL